MKMEKIVATLSMIQLTAYKDSTAELLTSCVCHVPEDIIVKPEFLNQLRVWEENILMKGHIHVQLAQPNIIQSQELLTVHQFHQVSKSKTVG